MINLAHPLGTRLFFFVLQLRHFKVSDICLVYGWHVSTAISPERHMCEGALVDMIQQAHAGQMQMAGPASVLALALQTQTHRHNDASGHMQIC